MSRPMHRHRAIRLGNLRAHRIELRASKAPAKFKAGVRRDARIVAKIKATAPGVPYSPEVQSWIAVQLGKPTYKASVEEIQALLA